LRKPRSSLKARSASRSLDGLLQNAKTAGLAFFLVVDDACDSSLGGLLDDVRAFIQTQPATTLAGVAYYEQQYVKHRAGFNQRSQQSLQSAADSVRESGCSRQPLSVTGGAVQFNRVIVRYGNGSQDEIAVRNQIPSGGKTRAIELPGDRRIIQSVELWYGKADWRTRPTVSLYGLR